MDGLRLNSRVLWIFLLIADFVQLRMKYLLAIVNGLLLMAVGEVGEGGMCYKLPNQY